MIHLICGSTGAGKTTYSTRLRRQLAALHLSIDDWMVTLFAPDTPPQVSWPWIEERLLRCERQILATALQLARAGMPSILDLGLQRADQRQRVADQVASVGIPTRLHFLDVDAGERWRRVEARNEFESQLNQASEYAASTLMGNPRLEEIIKGLRAWLDLAPASTPVTVLRGKMLELEKAITRA